jgi:hypothetical protein
MKIAGIFCFIDVNFRQKKADNNVVIGVISLGETQIKNKLFG